MYGIWSSESLNEPELTHRCDDRPGLSIFPHTGPGRSASLRDAQGALCGPVPSRSRQTSAHRAVARVDARSRRNVREGEVPAALRSGQDGFEQTSSQAG